MSSNTMNAQASQSAPVSQPWWKFGHVWLVVSGPLIVVIAAFFTLYLAIAIPDPVVAADYYRQGIEINKTLDAQAQAQASSLAPALQARNHAQTGVPAKVLAAKP
jgi:hypothetical protein